MNNFNLLIMHIPELFLFEFNSSYILHSSKSLEFFKDSLA
jgi:hypothetical protein